MLDALFLYGSAWTQPIDACARYVSAGVAANLPVGLDTWLEGDPWSIPLYVARTTDPQRALLYNSEAWLNVATGRWQRFGNSAAVEMDILKSSHPTFPFPGNVFSSVSADAWVLPPDYHVTDTQHPAERVYVPPAAVPASGPDGHLAVQQPDGTVVEAYAAIALSSGEMIALSYSVTNPSSLADGWQNGQTASMLPMYAGIIDDQEIADGHIDHAIAITVPAGLLVPEAAYPAYAFDRNALTENPAYAGQLPMGARLALPQAIDIASLRLSTGIGRVIATAARSFGFIVVDRGGAGITLRIRRNPAIRNPLLHGWNAPLQADLAAIFRRIRQVEPCSPD